MSSQQFEQLLSELCVDLGFCLPPDVQARLMADAPSDPDEFTDAVVRAEGLDPGVDISIRVRRDIRARVVRHFRAAEESNAG